MEKQEENVYDGFLELLESLNEPEKDDEKTRYLMKLREETGEFLVYGTDGETIITL